jgi:hypothetical protein
MNRKNKKTDLLRKPLNILIILILTTLAVAGPGLIGEGDPTKDILLEPLSGDWATCGITRCHFDTIITNNLKSDITINPALIQAIDIREPSPLIKSSSSYTRTPATREITHTDYIDSTYECKHTLVENPTRSLEASRDGNITEVYECVDDSKAKAEVKFDKDYYYLDDKSATFHYYETEEHTTTEEYIAETKQGAVIRPGESQIVRSYFEIPFQSSGKFDVELDVYVNDKLHTIILDPWWSTNYTYNREIFNLTQTQPINSSLVYSGSDIDANGTDEWIYAQNCSNGSMYIYYNDSETFAVTNGTDECFWFSTEPLDLGGGTADDGLVAYYPLDNSEAVAIDFVNGNNGTLVNSPTQGATGKINKAYDFNGTDDYISLPQISGVWDTISIWVNVDNTITKSVNAKNILGRAAATFVGIYLGGSITGNYADEMVTMLSDGTGKSCYWTDANTISAFTAGTWYNLVFVYASDNQYTLFIDGVDYGQCTKFGTFTRFDSETLLVGRYSTNYFDGQLDDLRIYNRTLSATEVQELYEMGAYLGAEEEYGITSITWNPPFNTTINKDYVTLNWTTNSNATSCNLSFNGTWYNQSGDTTDWTQEITDLVEGNYTINVTCSDDTNNVTSDNIWINHIPICQDSETFWLYFCVTDLQNTSWSSWEPIGSCLINDSYLEERSLEQYDANDCPGSSNQTFYEYRWETCDYCTPLATNTSWTPWTNITECFPNETSYYERSRDEYDSNFCYDQTGLESDEYENTTHYEYKWDSCVYDDEPPVITINSAMNQAVPSNHTFNISINELANCTLYLNSTDYANITEADSFTWNIYLSGYYTAEFYCTDLYDNNAWSSSYWLFGDDFPPLITVTWPDANSTITRNYTTITTETDELANCTLHFAGTDTPYPASTSQSWLIEDLAHGNYTPIYVTCNDTFNNSATTSTMWLNVTDPTEPAAIITVTWPDANRTRSRNYTTVTTQTDKLATCTLHFNGTDIPHAPSTSQSWLVENLTLGNYSTINVTCESIYSPLATTPNMWFNVAEYVPPPPAECTGSYAWLCQLGHGLGDFFRYMSTSFGYLLIYLAIAIGVALVMHAIAQNIRTGDDNNSN